jgi:hypothetical protein
MDDLERALPEHIIKLCRRSGNELVIPLDAAKLAIRIATENCIAVLGVEAFRLENGLGVETYSGYEFTLDDNWRDFVRINNEAAVRFIEENTFGDGYGYILTATSEAEFRALRT